MFTKLKTIGIPAAALLFAAYTIFMLSKIHHTNELILMKDNTLNHKFEEYMAQVAQNRSEAQVFTEIYDKNLWGGGSGQGSEPQNAEPYLQFLQKYLNVSHIHSIFDLGCGDWKLMSTLTIPDSKKYEGFDLVSSVINADISHYQKHNVNFHLINDIKDFQNQHGDLLIVKDVIQHWPNDEIQYFLKNILPNFKYAFITNGFHPLNINEDIKTGDFRWIDLQGAPFNVGKEFQVVLDYNAHGTTKRVYMYTNPEVKSKG